MATISRLERPTPAELLTDGPSRVARLFELSALFLKLGAISFGGPAAHVALIESEVVTKRQWITRRLLDMLGAANLIPGPTSTKMAINLWPTWIIAAAALAVLLRWKMNPAWVVLGSGVAGLTTL